MLDDRALASGSQFVLSQSDWQVGQPYLAETGMWEITPHRSVFVEEAI
jgi:hypothetical protein